MGSGLVGSHLKGVETGKLFPVSRSQLAQGAGGTGQSVQH